MATIGALTSNSYTVLQLLRGDESRREAVDKLCRQHPLQRVRVISVDTQSSGRSLALSQQLDLISTQREHRSLRRRVCSSPRRCFRAPPSSVPDLGEYRLAASVPRYHNPNAPGPLAEKRSCG